MSTITLPLSPRANCSWRSNRGRAHRSKRYTAWRRTAGWELVAQRPTRITGAVSVTITAAAPIGAGVTSTVCRKRFSTYSFPFY
jgi:Holliday junction resolvase RusA-like endonuclease